MYVPLVHECLRVNGRAGEFLVSRADYRRQVADLVSVSGNNLILENVSFRDLFAMWEGSEQVRSAAADEGGNLSTSASL